MLQCSTVLNAISAAAAMHAAAACPPGSTHQTAWQSISAPVMLQVRWGAHLLVIGFASGDVPKIPANIALVKNLTVLPPPVPRRMRTIPVPAVRALIAESTATSPLV